MSTPRSRHPSPSSRMPTVASGQFLNRRQALGIVLAGTVGLALTGCATTRSSKASSGSGIFSPDDDSATDHDDQPPGDGGKLSDEAEMAYPSKEEIVAAYVDVPAGEFGLDVTGTQLSLSEGCVAAALTLDACGGPGGSGVDEELIKILRDLQIPATLFINGRWARTNPETMQALVEDPLFEIQNHGTEHRPLSVTGQSAYGIDGTASPAEVYDEIIDNQEFLRQEYGVTCRSFRSGTAHLDEASAAICRDLGLTPVNFTVNLDDGASLRSDAVASRTREVSSGDIALGHFNQPQSGTAAGLAMALPQLIEDGLRFITLDEAC